MNQLELAKFSECSMLYCLSHVLELPRNDERNISPNLSRSFDVYTLPSVNFTSMAPSSYLHHAAEYVLLCALKV